MMVLCPRCASNMTQVKDEYVCEKCLFSRSLAPSNGAVLQYNLFSEYPSRIPAKQQKKPVSETAKPVKSPEQDWSKLPGIEEV